MTDFQPTARSRVRQVAARARYDRETIHAILDEGLVAHVGFQDAGQAFVIPMSYGRRGNEIVLHVSPTSRLARVAREGQSLCITVSLVDGVVIARTVAHHSMNFRSVVAFGVAREIVDAEEKVEAVRAILEQVVPGRWDEVRPAAAEDVGNIVVLAITLEEASAKIRSGSPLEPAKERDPHVWAGEIPLKTAASSLVPDAFVGTDTPLPASVRDWQERRPRA